MALNLDLLGQEVSVSRRREWFVSRDLVSKLLSELRSVVANLRSRDMAWMSARRCDDRESISGAADSHEPR